MRISLFGLVAPLLVGCALSAPTEGQQSEMVSAQPIPRTNGKFVGYYVVPAPANLTAAARFAMSKVEWSVSSGIATLEYDLPTGLVGGEVEVTLRGPLPSGATSVQLSGINGSGTCTASGTTIACSEDLANLGTLPVSMAVVAQVAAAEYPGPVADRTAVANLFSSDPIGTVYFDLSQPSPDGGGHGGGGGRGPH